MMLSGWKRDATAPSIFKWNRRGESSLHTGLLGGVPPEIELSDYQRLPSPASDSPSGLLNGEGLKLDTIADLDVFLERVYNYHCQKGLRCIIVKWIVELLSLGFTIAFSCFILLFVDWPALYNTKCGKRAVESGIEDCDLVKIAIHKHPFVPFTFAKAIIVGYLALCTIFLLFCFLRFFAQLKGTLGTHSFFYTHLNITDREVQTTPWPIILEKIVEIQQSHRLCVVKDLSYHDVVMRIMRKENYLIGMINKGILAFPISRWVPGAGPATRSSSNGEKKRLVLTKTLQWTLNWCILQSMFDRNYCIRSDFISNPSSLRKQLIVVGIVMFLLSPFLVIFMLMYLFLRHAEQFYNDPRTAISRRWSNLSKWIFREFNEVEHLFKQRMNNSVDHASDFLKQFPSPIVSLIAKFISFVSGGLAAVLIIIAFLEESLFEGRIFGRNLFFYGALIGAALAFSRSSVADDVQVHDPRKALSLVVQHTHYMPKRWRGKENLDSVRVEFESLFQYTGMMLLEEMVSIFLTPYLLIFVVPKRVDDILQFISEFTVDVEGVGHVCSFSTFDFEIHGNRKYGSPFNGLRDRRSSQGKMEKSFLSFQNTYPSWEPNSHGQQLLSNLYSFEEQQAHQDTLTSYAASSWKPGLIHRDQSEVIRRFCSPRDVPGYEYNMGAHAIGNHEESAHPYILERFYVAQPLHAGNDTANSTLQHDLHARTSNDYCMVNIPPKFEEGTEENWNYHTDDRLQSQFGASSSMPLTHGSIFRHYNSPQPEEHTDSHWWARPAPQSSGPETSFHEPPSFGQKPSAGETSFLEPPSFGQKPSAGETSFLEPPSFGQKPSAGETSFLEPPSFGQKPSAGETSFLEPPDFSHANFAHHDNISDATLEEQEDVAATVGPKNPEMPSRSTYLPDDEDHEFSLPFGDLYTGPSSNLPFNVHQTGA